MSPSSDTTSAITVLYHEFLKREPDKAGLAYWCKIANEQGFAAVIKAFSVSDEYKDKSARERLDDYCGYATWELKVIREFIDPNARPQPGFVVDFMGTRIRTSSLWSSARTLDGTVTPVPIPGDFHSEAVEWLGVLKSVQSARGQYVAMELGAGLGPWIIAGGSGARKRGIDNVRLYAVEADPTHYKLLRQNLEDNGFCPDEHILIHAAVGVRADKARWPIIEDSREDWGTRPVEGAKSDYLGRTFDSFLDIDIVPIIGLVVREPRWDLLHIDVQGHEYHLCAAAIEELSLRVRWLVIGTHSRLLDGKLIELLFAAGWELKHEKPSKFRFNAKAETLESMTFVDGVQVWRNPRLE